MQVTRKGVCTIIHNYTPDDTDMYVDEIGHIITEPLRKQKYERGGYCIHYFIKGKAIVNGNLITSGQGYIMPPLCRIEYISDKDDPCEYAWIIVEGTKAKYFLRGCGFNGKFQIFDVNDAVNIARKIRDACYEKYDDKNLNLYFMSLFYNAMSYHKKTENVQAVDDTIIGDDVGAEYVKQALIIIHSRYDDILTVDKLANEVHISQNYLCRLFNKFMDCTPQVYIAKYRIEIAKKLLKENGWGVTDTAKSVGYFDPQYFSQVFKKYTGKSPREYKKEDNGK